MNSPEIWIGFNLFVVAMLAVDLGLFHRRSHEVRMREALGWSAVWITLALIFNYGIYLASGREKALQFLAGYVLEKSLSVDNLFVFILVFKVFRVAPKYQHKVLFWGILGALIMRAFFIMTGIALIERFHWMIYVFGVFLIFTGAKMLRGEEKEVDPRKNLLIRAVTKVIPIADDDSGKLFVRRDGKLFATSLFIVLIVIESTDVVFAVDSIPAILAISTDPFIVYTSNVFAILGLRALYFALAGLMKLFHYLHFGLSLILIFVGTKMLMSDYLHLPIAAALGVIAAILALSVAASVIWPKKGGVEAGHSA
jgi:tellurite resistance protein TerC